MYFYSSASKADMGVLTNQWGDFNKLINYIIDGGNNVSIMRIEGYSNNRIRIYYDDSLNIQPWVVLSTIIISGSSIDEYNDTFILEQYDPVGKSYIAHNKRVGFDANAIDNNINIIARTVPCGATRVFGGVNDKRTVIQFEDDDGGHMQYRIDDRDWSQLLVPPITAGATYVKTARISMSENYDALDFTTSRIYPYNEDRPSENFMPHGKYIGQCHIPYNVTNHDTQYIHHHFQTTNNEWRVYASDKMMLVQIMTNDYNSLYSYQLMFGVFERYNKDINNGFLICKKISNATWDTTAGWMYPYDRTQSVQPFMNNNPDRNWNSFVIMNDTTELKFHEIYLLSTYTLGSNIPSGWSTNRIPYPTINNATVYISDIEIVSSSMGPWGKIHDIKWINSAYLMNRDSRFDIDDDIYIAFRSNISTSDGSCSVFIKLDY